MRVGIIALLQESNTFVSKQTRLADFEADVLLTGDAVLDYFRDKEHEVGGFIAGLEAAGIEAVPVIAARALPFGTIQDGTFRELTRRLLEELRKALPLDGLLVAPHGATVAENHPDADGYWLTQARVAVGLDVPIIGTMDPHANLSPAMVAATDALLAYETNPHLDQRARGEAAAKLLARTLRGEVRPRQAAAFPPLAINIQSQNTAAEPLLSLYRKASEVKTRPGVLDASLVLGFPYADVREMGSSVLVVTDGDEGLARKAANELAARMWERRAAFEPEFLSVESAITRALAAEPPVCLLDMGDNVGGGSPGDSTFLARALHEGGHGPAFVCLQDADAVRQAHTTGTGGRLTLQVGGKTDSLHGEPLELVATVISLHEGKFHEPQARHGGFGEFDQGATAIVETATGALTLMLTSRRMAPFSLAQLTAFDLEPGAFRFLVAKGVIAPLAAYREVCRTFLHVNTPGVTCADMKQLKYRHRRRPMYPFESTDTVYTP